MFFILTAAYSKIYNIFYLLKKLDIFSKIVRIMEEHKKYNDSVRFYKVCDKCLTQTKIIGKGKIEKRPEYLII